MKFSAAHNDIHFLFPGTVAVAFHSLHQGLKLGQPLPTEHIPAVPPHDVFIELQHSERRWIDGGQYSLSVHRDDSGSDVLQHGFDVAPAPIDFGVFDLEVVARLFQSFLTGLELCGHPIKRVHEHPELIHRRPGYRVVQVSRHDALGRLGQLAYRHRNALS